MTEQRKLGKIQKWGLKRALKRYEKIKKKWEKEDEQTKQRIIQAIQSMQPTITIHEDEEQTIITTPEMLQQKTQQELEKIFTEMIEFIKREIGD